MIRLITGVPGAGKTLFTLDTLKAITDRPIYHNGIPDLTLPWACVADPANWHDAIPDGSILVIDECQRVFPVRDHKKEVPGGVTAMETHRHRGIDIYLVTQHPNLIDHHVRRLVGEHYHLTRSFGAPFATLYHGNAVLDVSDKWKMAQEAEKKQWFYPKDSFGLYKSAEVHTHKFKLPKKMLLLPLALFVVGASIWFLLDTLNGRTESIVGEVAPNEELSSSIPATEGGPVSGEDLGRAPDLKSMSWADRLKPEIPGLPYTAPLYSQSIKATDIPKISGCIEHKTACTCYTQQGTVIADMDSATCKSVVDHGVYDPFRQSSRESVSPDPIEIYERAAAIYASMRQPAATAKGAASPAAADDVTHVASN